MFRGTTLFDISKIYPPLSLKQIHSIPYLISDIVLQSAVHLNAYTDLTPTSARLIFV